LNETEILGWDTNVDVDVDVDVDVGGILHRSLALSRGDGDGGSGRTAWGNEPGNSNSRPSNGDMDQ
jgi:hypothetical protein